MLEIRREPKSLCFFSVVRYVADPIRNEAKNIGVILICPEEHFAGAQFQLSRASIPSGTQHYNFIKGVLQEYQVMLPGYQQPTLFAPASEEWTRGRLEELHQECTNLIQFTQPAAVVGEPAALLQKIFRERVLPTRAGLENEPAFSTQMAAGILRQALAPIGRQDWVHVWAKVSVGNDTYPFDIAIQNGRLYYVIQTLSFKTSRLQHVEDRGAWYALAWSAVSQETGAKGILLVDPPEEQGSPQERFRRVKEWVSDVGIVVKPFRELNAIVEEISAALS